MGKPAVSLSAGLRVDPAALEGLSDADRDAVTEQLSALEGEFKRNPLLAYNHPVLSRPHPKQLEFHAPAEGGAWPRIRLFLGGNRCLPAGTLVRMADGSAKPIELIEAGEWVFGSSPEGVTRPVRVVCRFDNGLREVERYWFGKRREELHVDATPSHEFSAVHEKYGPKVTSLHRMTSFPTTRIRWSVRRSLGWDLPEGDGEDMAMLVGLLLGDGCLTGKAVQFTSADDDVTDLFEAELGKVGCRLSRSAANPIQFVAANVAVKATATLKECLRELGLCCYAHKKAIPAVCWKWSTPAIARLVAGLLLTDGSVYEAAEGWRVNFTSTSRPLAEGLRRLLAERLGVYGSSLLENKRPDKGEKGRTEWSFVIGNFASVMRLAQQVRLVGRKQRLLECAISHWDGKRSDGAQLRYRRRESLGMLPTYDLHVDHEDHLFVLANGLITHNSGKTTSTMVDTIIQCVDRELVPEHLLGFKRWDPPFYCRVVIPDLTRSLEGVTLQKFREWCPKAQLHGSSMDRAWEKQQLMLRFKNGSWVQFMSNDQDLDKFGGAALHRVVYDEEPRGDIRRECLMRLIDFGGEELYGLTPLHGMSWIYDEFYEPWESGHGSDDVRIVVVDMDDNPHLDDDTKEWVLAGLGSEERQARKSGRFVSFAGLIYPEWSEGKFVVPQPPELPHGVEVFCGIDPGYRHMCAVLYCYLDHEDDLVVFDEIAMPRTIISEICKEIQLRNKRWGVRPNWYVIDPAARNKNGQTGRSDQQEFADNGVYTIPGQNDVTAGINRVKERLAAEPEPRLHIAAACSNLRLEFKKYRWVKETNRGENAAAEKPVKKDDHCLDALRYVAMARPLAPAQDRPRPTDTMKDRILRHHLRKVRGGRKALPDSGFGPGMHV